MKPTYDLKLIKGLMQQGSWGMTLSAEDGAIELGFEDDDVYDCIVNHLEESHFHKTMASEKKAALMQDVYYITYEGQQLYVKLQVSVDVVVVSFKKQ